MEKKKQRYLVLILLPQTSWNSRRAAGEWNEAATMAAKEFCVPEYEGAPVRGDSDAVDGVPSVVLE